MIGLVNVAEYAIKINKISFCMTSFKLNEYYSIINNFNKN